MVRAVVAALARQPLIEVPDVTVRGERKRRHLCMTAVFSVANCKDQTIERGGSHRGDCTSLAYGVRMAQEAVKQAEPMASPLFAGRPDDMSHGFHPITQTRAGDDANRCAVVDGAGELWYMPGVGFSPCASAQYATLFPGFLYAPVPPRPRYFCPMPPDWRLTWLNGS